MFIPAPSPPQQLPGVKLKQFLLLVTLLPGKGWEEHGGDDGKGQQGLGGMDVPRFSVGIKAGLLRRQLPSNNARDQGKASEQGVFLCIPRSIAGIVLRYFFNISFDPSWKC